MEFAEWKKQVEKDYEEWKVTHTIVPSQKKGDKVSNAYVVKDNKQRITKYLEKILADNECYDGFKKARKKYRAGKYDYAISFVQFVYNFFIEGKSKKEISEFEFPETVNEKNEEFYRELAQSKTLRKHLQDNDYRFLFESSAGYWLDFCSALHKYFGLFDSWKTINKFCKYFCYSKKRENFLYVRNPEDICSFYAIARGETHQFQQETYKKLKGNILSKNAGEYGEQVTQGTQVMMDEISICADWDEKIFLQMIQNSYLRSIGLQQSQQDLYSKILYLYKGFARKEVQCEMREFNDLYEKLNSEGCWQEKEFYDKYSRAHSYILTPIGFVPDEVEINGQIMRIDDSESLEQHHASDEELFQSLLKARIDYLTNRLIKKFEPGVDREFDIAIEEKLNDDLLKSNIIDAIVAAGKENECKKALANKNISIERLQEVSGYWKRLIPVKSARSSNIIMAQKTCKTFLEVIENGASQYEDLRDKIKKAVASIGMLYTWKELHRRQKELLASQTDIKQLLATKIMHRTAIKKIRELNYSEDDFDDEDRLDSVEWCAEVLDDFIFLMQSIGFKEIKLRKAIFNSGKDDSGLTKNIIKSFLPNIDEVDCKALDVRDERYFIIERVLSDDNNAINKAIRYFAFLAAMLNSRGKVASVADLRKRVNKFLSACYVREFTKSSYDDFDWFIYNVWQYEEDNGLLRESCGLDTLARYLQSEQEKEYEG